MKMVKKLELAGKKFGRLEVVSEADSLDGRSAWHCMCACGSRTIIRGSDIKTGNTRSCGCMKKERPSNLKHGQSKTRLYLLWKQMVARCEYPSNTSYYRYGAIGIKVCPRWRYGDGIMSGYECFVADMGEKPTGKSLDRVNNDGNYEPANCRWATYTEQARNKRNNAQITYGGREYTWSELAEIGLVSPQLLRSRVVRYGWSINDALFTLPKKNPSQIAPARGCGEVG